MKPPRSAPAFLVAVVPCLAQGPVATDSDKHTVLLDNPGVRVLEYRNKTGEVTQHHQHAAFVLCTLAPCDRMIHGPGGKDLGRSIQAGENVGSIPTHAMTAESKPAGRASCR
ncbi:hypothetical protein BG841_05300 [Marinobacter sp. X15-166B]|nr:hypothetical protein BG841_05300 [Marinobacter sp. X15-166B]